LPRQKIFTLLSSLTDSENKDYIKFAYENSCDHYPTKDQCETGIGLIAQDFMDKSGDNFEGFFQEKFVTQNEGLKNEILSL
jgi:hypothetical protein